MYAFKLLRVHRLDDTALQAVFRSIVMARFFMPPQHGGDSPEPRIDKELRDSYVGPQTG